MNNSPMRMTHKQLMSLYRDGKNIIEMLRQVSGLSTNSKEIIEIAYDLQAGSYVSAMENDNYRNHKNEYTAEIARIISGLGETATLLEAGVGEATTLSGVLKHLPANIQHVFGFDLSWSRIARQKLVAKRKYSGSHAMYGRSAAYPFRR